MKYIGLPNFLENSVQFLEGFFDAEGCVKVIKEVVRRTPKICLDITNTRLELLQTFNEIMERSLGIRSHFSEQIDRRANRKKVFHLRIYKKSEIAGFLNGVDTLKLTALKGMYLRAWLRLSRGSRI